ncbi:MAG TPA: ketol-acid reductoisomerase [Pantanalinema sp.]
MGVMHYDADVAPLTGRRIAVIGYGAQGHAHALNLRDSGFDVRVGLYEGSPSWARAKAAGLRVMTVEEACDEADAIAVMVPDERIPALFEGAIAPRLSAGDALFFAHGFAVQYGQIRPPSDVDVILAAPMGQGNAVRRLFTEGGGMPCLVAVHQDASGNAMALALAYAKGLGAHRAGILETTFKEETETDLFAEQAVLVGGVNALIKASFETLVEAGYQSEVAYFSSLHELKAVIDVLQREGLAGQRRLISNTAEYGADRVGPRLIDARVKQEMRAVLSEIQDGSFARAWIAESANGCPSLAAERAAEDAHPIEEVGARLRAMMPWLARV